MYLDLFRTMSSADQQGLDYSKMLQFAYELGLTPQNPTTSDSTQQPTTTNDIVILESDDDTTAKAE
jgi:hypothetical protein